MSWEDNRNYRRSGDKATKVDLSKDYMDYLRVSVKGLADPIWWIEHVLGVSFDPNHTPQKDIIRTFYRDRYTKGSMPYKKLILLAGMRSGKTALGSMIGTYELWKATTYKNLAEEYGLLKGQRVTLAVMSTSKEQAEDGIFGNISNYIEDSEWLQTWGDFNVRNDYIESTKKNILLRSMASWSQTAVGRSNILVVLDELDNFEATTGKRGAWNVYSRLSKSTDTFGIQGKLIAISSSNDSPGSIMNVLIREGTSEMAAKGAKSQTLALIKPTWEMNLALKEDDLRETYKHDMASFWRDYACKPGLYVGVEFNDGVKLASISNVLENMFIADPRVSRVLSIDPAVKNDGFGVACGYSLNGRIVIDGVYKFKRQGDDPFISPTDIKDFLHRAYKYLNINALIYDTWMFPEIIEEATTQFGITTSRHIVYKEDYDRWKSLQSAGIIDVVANEELASEVNSLIIVNEKRVDHPSQGSKDMADAVANTIWYLSTQVAEESKPKILLVRGF